MRKSLVAIVLVAPAILGINSALHALLPGSPKASAATAVPIHRQIATRAPVLQASAGRGILPIIRSASEPMITRHTLKPAPANTDPNQIATDPIEIHGEIETSIVVSKDDPTHQATIYSASTSYPQITNPPSPFNLGYAANTATVSSRSTAFGAAWSPNTLQCPENLPFNVGDHFATNNTGCARYTVPSGSNGVFQTFATDSYYDSFGDPVLAANQVPQQNGPQRVYLAGTTWKAGNGVTDHLQNQITVWSHDPASGTHWVVNTAIDANPLRNPNGHQQFDFDDKPAIAVSDFALTLGNVYVAYDFFDGNTLHASIRMRQSHRDPNGQDVWGQVTTVYDNSHSAEHAIGSPRLDIDQTNGQIYLSWLDYGLEAAPGAIATTVNVMTSADGTHWLGPFQADTGGTSKGLLIPGDDTDIRNAQSTRVQAPSFLSTSVSTSSDTLVLVYHRRKVVDRFRDDRTPSDHGSEVVMQSFNLARTLTNPPSNPFNPTPVVVSQRALGEETDEMPGTHDYWHVQWGGAVACDQLGVCAVAYYDHEVEPTAGSSLFSYTVRARRLKDDGNQISDLAAKDDVAIYGVDADISTQSNAQTFFGSFMEYRDIFYRSPAWYIGSVITDPNPVNTNVLVYYTAAQRIHAVKANANGLPITSPIPINTKTTISIDVLPEDSDYVTWQATNRSGVTTQLDEHGRSFTVSPTETTTYSAQVTTFGGILSTRQSILVTVCPEISVAPVSTSAVIPAAGEGTVSTHVSAQGVLPVYTWYDWDTNALIPPSDATLSVNGDTVTLHSAVATHRTVFAKIASCGATVSTNPVSLTLVKACTPPQFYMDGSGPILPNTFVTLNAYLDPLPSQVTYQWYRGSDNAPMCNGPSCAVTTATYDTFYCVVTITCTDTSTSPPTSTTYTLTSPNAYVRNISLCEVPPIGILQSATNIPADSTTGVSFTAILDWGDVTFQWYKGQSRDTSTKVAADNGAGNHITVGRSTDGENAGPGAYWVRGFLPCGAVRDSETLTFTKGGCAPILFDPQPQSGVIASGDPATLVVDTPLTPLGPTDYTWRTVVLVPSPTEPGGFIDEGVVVDTGKNIGPRPDKTTKYRVTAIGCTTAKSAIATVRVGSCDSITVNQWPQSLWIDSGQSATLTVSAAPVNGTLTYKWFLGELGDESAPLAETTETLHTPFLSDSTQYWVRLEYNGTNGHCFADSDTINVSVCHPASAGLDAPVEYTLMPWLETTRIHFSFAGTALTYQWYQGTPGDVSTPIGGNADVTVVRALHTTTYWVRATSHCGNDDPAAPRTKDSPPIRVSVCPVIIQQPVGPSTSVTPGLTATLTAESRDSSDTFEWYQGESGDLSRPSFGNTRIVTTPPITADTTFWARVTNGTCFTDSESVTVHVCIPPSVQWASFSHTVSAVQPVTISISGVAGEADIFWYQGNSGDVSHPTGTPANQLYAQVGPLALTTSFWARVQQGTCWTDLPTMTIQVCLPVISQSPTDALINAGESKTLTVVASPTSGLTYQWYTGASGDTSNPISGETTASYAAHPSVATSYWVRVDGGCGVTADSATATVSICQPPAILTQTPAVSIVRGTSVPFMVNATGTNLTYQWYIGTAGVTTLPITGATGSTMTQAPQDNINYWVRVTGTCGAVDSLTIPVSVCANPTIATQPQSVTVFSGATAALTVAATPATSSPVTYQWYRGNAGDTSSPMAAPNGTSQSFTTPPLTTQTNYWARATCGICTPADSQTATVSICPIPSTLPSPGNVNVAVGQSGQLSTITGTGNTYQWYVGPSGNISVGAPSATSTLSVAPAVTTSYWCRVTNGTCTTDTPVGTVNVCIPAFTQSPQSIMINAGSSTTLTSSANTAGVTYQWYTGNSSDTSHPIAGATSATYLAQPSSTTTYWVRATGTCSSTADSTAATVSICQVPAITSNTTSLSIVRGQNTTCLVNATGSNLTYQWYIGTTGVTTLPITGATGSTMTSSPQDNINYWVSVTGTCGAVNSATIPVSVCAIPVIATPQPQSSFIFSGGTKTLTVSATEATSLGVTYQWYRGAAGDTTNLAGTGTSFTTPALTSQTSYWARATCGVCTPADSPAATVSICPIPATLSSPGNVNVAVGQAGHLSTITGSGNTYQWYTGASGNTSVGAPSTTSTLDIAPSVTTSYWCRVTNGTCVTDTPSGTVNVCIPTFTTLPQSITITAGSSTTLTSAANTAGVTYRWYVGASGNTASPVTGGTNANLTITPSSTTSYWVRATGTCGTADSATVTVTICQPPVITNPPHDASGVYGNGNAYFGVTASGSNLSYQWYVGDSGVTTNPVGDGTNALTLPISTTTKVWVRVTGQCGVVNSPAVFASVYSTVTLTTPSTISVGYNSTATISLNASGNYLHYAWKWSNGTAIAGAADSPTLITPSIPSDSDVFCQVTSGAVITNSPDTTLTVCSDQLYIYGITPTNSGSCKVLTISTTNWAYDYQWYQGVRGDTSHPAGSGYAQIYVCPTVATQYWCRVVKTTPDGYAGCYTDSNTITVP